MKKLRLLWLVVMAESRVGIIAIVAAIAMFGQLVKPSMVWAQVCDPRGCTPSGIGCLTDKEGACDTSLTVCVPGKPNTIPPCCCRFSFFCSSADATLVNIEFPVSGELTYDISSPDRILQSINVESDTNIASFTLPSISSDGHRATGGVFIKANSSASASFELGVAFITPAFGCNIDPATTTLRIDKGHVDAQSLSMVPKTEHFIEIDNGSPGLNWVRIDVNGKYYRALSLTSGGTIHLDASAAMSLEENTLRFTGEGKTGSSANISLSDSAPASQTGSKSASPQGTGKRLMFRF